MNEIDHLRMLGSTGLGAPESTSRAAARSALDATIARHRPKHGRLRGRLATGMAVGVLALVLGSLLVVRDDDAGDARNGAPTATLPRGGTAILPDFRVVAYYGAAWSGAPGTQLGVLGSGTPVEVADRLSRTAAEYDRYERPILPAVQLIASLATSEPGPDGLYRTRATASQIDTYLQAARQENAILILDIQPGRANIMDEVRSYRRYLEMPDVSLALDPEWAVGPTGIPGDVFGSTDAATINEVSAYLDQIVTEAGLPQKLLLVHEFRGDLIRDMDRIVQHDNVALVLNVDGFGTPEAKRGKYAELAGSPRRPPFAFHGFKLFYEEDTREQSRLMTPAEVLALEPPPDVIVYE